MQQTRSSKEHDEVLQAMRTLAKAHGAPYPGYYNSALSHLGAIPVPVQRKRSLEGYSFSGGSVRQVERVWQLIWRASPYFEVKTQALLYFEPRRKKLTLHEWRLLAPWAKQLDNWAHSDSLSAFYAELFEKYPQTVLPTLQRWNNARAPWLRRQSLVSLFYYSSLRKERVPAFELCQSFIEARLGDSHFYVQRGLGWALREMYNVYPKQTFELLQRIASALPAAAWQAASEKLGPKQKAALKGLRRKPCF